MKMSDIMEGVSLGMYYQGYIVIMNDLTIGTFSSRKRESQKGRRKPR
jgi:hypothetical protein